MSYRILYISDWNEKINESKLKILSKFGDEIFTPDLDYINNRNIISSLSNNVDFDYNNLIIGNMMGAYLALYVSNITKIPSLLFNPSFYFKNGCELKSVYDQEQFPEKKILLSAKHDIVDTRRTFKYLRELGYDNQLKVFENLKTDIPIDIFEIYFKEFREKYSNFDYPNKPKKDKKDIQKKTLGKKTPIMYVNFTTAG